MLNNRAQHSLMSYVKDTLHGFHHIYLHTVIMYLHGDVLACLSDHPQMSVSVGNYCNAI